MTQRNFLRKQVIEYKELDGLRKGFRVSAIVNNQPEQGSVKWIGTIRGTMYIGIQFERPVGNQFPETNGAAPFPCTVAHSRLVFPKDVKRAAASAGGVAIMEHEQQHHHLCQVQQQDAEHYLLEAVSYMSVGSHSHVSAKVHSVMNRHIHQNTGDNSEYDSQFVSTSPSYTVNASDQMELKEFDEALSLFYKCCSQAKRLIKEFHVKFEELPIHCRFEDCASLNVNLDKLKGFRNDFEENYMNQFERCKLGMETVMRYSEALLPSEERRMSHEIQEIEQSFNLLDQDICSEIEGLDSFSMAYQNLQDFLHERLSRFAVIKTRLVQVERNLVKDERALCLRIKGLQSILSVLDRDHDDNNHDSEINRLLSDVQVHDYIDISRVLSQARDLILAERQLLDEVRTKRALLLEAKKSFAGFTERYSKFQTWYADYMKRLSETKVTGPDFDLQHPSLVTEREEKRKEFIEILSSARSLRASIFDSSAVDEKIEALQDQWKELVEKVYRARSRKTM